jgi:hypothetical protein
MLVEAIEAEVEAYIDRKRPTDLSGGRGSGAGLVAVARYARAGSAAGVG